MLLTVLPDLLEDHQWRNADIVLLFLGSNDASLEDTNHEQVGLLPDLDLYPATIPEQPWTGGASRGIRGKLAEDNFLAAEPWCQERFSGFSQPSSD